MLHINTVPLTKNGLLVNYWAKFMLNNEEIRCVFFHDGEEIYVAKNIGIQTLFGTVGMIAYLYNIENACIEVENILDNANKKGENPLSKLSVFGGIYHE